MVSSTVSQNGACETSAFLSPEHEIESQPPAPQGEPPFPWKAMVPLILLNPVQPLAFELIFPFVNQMIVENGIANAQQVGFYSGLLESSFALCSFLLIMPFTMISDHYGRKPIILSGMFFVGLSTVLFGLSKTFGWMLITRCVGGGAGGAWAAARVIAAELCSHQQLGKAYAYLQISYRIGQIAGQPMGGLLAHPERHFPSIPGISFWRAYPFELPCVVAALLAWIAVWIGIFTLPETLTKKRKRAIQKGEVVHTYGSIEDSLAVESPINPPQLVTNEVDMKDSNGNNEDEEATFLEKVQEILTWNNFNILFGSSLMCLSSEFLFCLYPLFAFTPIPLGGLGLTEAQIGAHTATRSLVTLILLFVYSPVESALGPLRVYKIAVFLWPVTFCMLPYLSFLAKQGLEGTWWFSLSVLAFFVVWSFACYSWTSITVIISQAGNKRTLGTMNGVSQMCLILPQALAPAMATSIFAFSIERQNILDGKLYCFILGGITLFTFFQGLLLKTQ